MRLLVLLGIFPLLSLVATAPSRPVLPGRHDQSSNKALAAALVRRISKANTISCVTCSSLVEAVKVMLSVDTPKETVMHFLRSSTSTHVYCCGFKETGIVSKLVFHCKEICGVFLADCGNSFDPLHVMWNFTIPGNKPPVKSWPSIPVNKPTLRVLHLSDLHIDRDYVEGSEADCQGDNWLDTYALCCRNYTEKTQGKVKHAAGKWGSPYPCDIPFRTFESAMQHIAKKEKDRLDYIIITGDMESHDIWNYTRQKTSDNIANITTTLLKYFPGVKIYESVGNHEGVPEDAMAPHTMEQYDTRGPQWLYSALSNAWGNWISVQARNDVQYYMYINQEDPDSTLEWLVEQLLDSESKGEKVHIISHIPPGVDYCLKGWSHNFYEIINRFENTITGQFYGHTHFDHFQVYYDQADPNGRPTNFNFIAPSLTTYDYNNPSFRIYTIDGGYKGASYTTKEAETYYADVEQANREGHEPEAYGMTDLSPASWHELIGRLSEDPELFRLFHQNYRRNENYEENCAADTKCRQKYLCALKTARSHDGDHFCSPSLH